jgi:hypothetical protein
VLGRILTVLAGVSAALGVGLAVYAPAPSPTLLRIDPASFAADLDGRLRESAAGVHSRATTLASLPLLSSAVSTDSATVQNLTQEELAFRPSEHETITIGQVPNSGPPVVLLALPAGATPARGFQRIGTRAELIDGQLDLTEVVPVRARERADQLRGALAVTWQVDVSALSRRLDDAGLSARLEVDGQTVTLGARPIAPGDPLAPVPLASEVGRALRVSLVQPPIVSAPPYRPIGIGVAVLSVLVAGLLFRAGRSGGAAPAAGDDVATSATQAQVADPISAPPPTPRSNAGATEIGIGSVIQDTYEITELLGRGGMGAVWAARHLRLPDKRVAIKLLLGENLQPELFARFQREAEVTSRLGHPNIVGVLDFNTLPTGAPYIVLEFLKGESLATRLQRGPLSLQQTLEITRQIGSALDAAHRAEIVHRDLKPDNVFLVPVDVDGVSRDQAKVLDFGISKMRGNVAVQTQESAMLGTPQYMSPEQANGKNSEVDRRSDVWALGAIIYEMLTGQCAFAGDTLPQVLVKIVVNPSPSLRGVAGVPPHVVDAVDRALAKEPGERFPDVRRLITALSGAELRT